MCLATSNNLLLVLQDAPNRIFSTNSRSSASRKTMQRHFFPPSITFPLVIFATAAVVAFVLLGNSRLIFHCYTQREATPQLRPFATSCAKDYEGLSLVQTCYTEPPNRQQTLNLSAETRTLHSISREAEITWNKLESTNFCCCRFTVQLRCCTSTQSA